MTIAERISQERGNMLRDQTAGHARVTFIELFFDLVYVLAITQLSHSLLEHLTVRGALQTLLLAVAVWVAWIYTTWFTNWFDPARRPVRVVLLGIMLISLIMSATIPHAFGERGLLFASAFVAMQLGRTAFMIWALEGDPVLRRNFQRIIVWLAASGVLWVAGGFAEDGTREALWLAAVLVDLTGPIAGFVVPGLGRSRTTDWNISGEHMAERCELFLILALGESILITGATFGELDYATATVAAFVVAFIGSVALWWIYFDRSGEDGSAAIASDADPGRLGRNAYTYFHLPMVAGIIVTAVGDELSIAHPRGHTDTATIAVMLGGPALFLAGHALFKWSVWGRISTPRLLAIAILAVLAPVGTVVPPLALAALATLVLVGVGVWDWWFYRTMPLPSRATPSSGRHDALAND